MTTRDELHQLFDQLDDDQTDKLLESPGRKRLAPGVCPCLQVDVTAMSRSAGQ
jgi:hypothetical protein